MLARIRLFHNFCTIVKERDETRRTKYRRVISQLNRDQLLFIDESAKRWQDFSGKYQYNQLCKREREHFTCFTQYVLRTMTDILKTQNCKTDKRSFVDAPYMVWLTAAETQFSPDEKPPTVA